MSHHPSGSRVTHSFAGGRGLAKHPAAWIRVDAGGAQGDRHYGRDPERALLMVPAACYRALRQEGFALPAGAMGENLVVEGLPPNPLAGTRLDLGPVRAVVTGPCTVCAALGRIDPNLPKAAHGRRGVHLRVVRGGVIRPGDPVVRIEPSDDARAPRAVATGGAGS